jgi:hypothetical protein
MAPSDDWGHIRARSRLDCLLGTFLDCVIRFAFLGIASSGRKCGDVLHRGSIQTLWSRRRYADAVEEIRGPILSQSTIQATRGSRKRPDPPGVGARRAGLVTTRFSGRVVNAPILFHRTNQARRGSRKRPGPPVFGRDHAGRGDPLAGLERKAYSQRPTDK